ncbi:MAG: glycosyltransferase family 4 protein [Gemmatimonadales bacterium]|nr:glycosyltransferase family 4 protein [Gemmatimonadales bacterium]
MNGAPIAPVLLLTPRWPTAGTAARSGLIAYAENAAAGLAAAGVPVEVLAFAERDRALPARSVEAGRVIHRANLGWVRLASRLAPGIVSGHRLLDLVRRVMAGRRFLAVEVPNFEGIGWAVARAIPEGWLRLHTPHWDGFATGAPPRRHHDRVVRALDRYTARRMPHLITHSEAHAAAMRHECRLGDRPIHVVPHGVPDPGLQPPDAVEPGRILAIGPLDRRKGADLLLEAFLRLAPQHPGLSLTIVGPVDDPGIRERIAGLDPAMATRIELPGRLPDAELATWWHRAAIVVAASRYESFGLVAAEAMARGIPTVVSSTPALVEVVGDAGVVFPAGNADGLASALHALLADPTRQDHLRRLGRARFEERFGIEAMGRGMLAAFTGSLDRSHMERGAVLAGPRPSS